MYDTKKPTKAVPCSKKCTASCTQCDGLKFKPDQKVEVIRSDGAYSPGYIVGKGWEGFDGPTYKVQLDDGLCKQAVPEEEISDEVRRPTVRAGARVRVGVRVTNNDPNPNQVRMSWMLGGWVSKAAGNRKAYNK